MSSKFVVFCALFAVVKAGVLTPIRYTATPAVAHNFAYANPAVDAVASTHQNVVRSFDGTVSTYSKAIDTPYSSVRKADTRVSNNVYTPTVQKTLTYATPAAPVTITKSIAYAAAPVIEKHDITYTAPAVSYPAPVIEKTAVTYAAPAVTKTIYAHSAPNADAIYTHPATTVLTQQPNELYTHAIPKTVAPISPISTLVGKPIVPVTTTNFNHGPAATTYTHSAPGVSGYGSSQTIHYSPAEMVSHMSFDGFGTHWGY